MRSIVAALLLAALSSAAWPVRAQSDDLCVELLRGAEASGARYELVVSGDSQGYERVAFMPAPSSDVEETGRYLQINRYFADAESSWDGLDTFVCDGDRLLLYEFRPEVGSPGVEQFDPPLPWLVLPLEGGFGWDWEGQVTVPSDAGPTVVESRIAFEVGALESVVTQAGVFDAWPVEAQVFLQAESEAFIRTVTWFTTEPHFGLVRRERYRPAASTTPLWTWQLARIAEVDPPVGAPPVPAD